MNKVCTKCGESRPVTQFAMNHVRGQRVTRCQPCSTAATKEWRKRQPDYDRQRYQATKSETRERHLVRKYKVTLEDYARMLAAQDGRCAICLAPESEQFKGVFHVDHCHASGAVRGLLCRGCNHALGVFKDDPALFARAVEYLSSRKSRKSSAGPL
jgi:hypothetical protein